MIAHVFYTLFHDCPSRDIDSALFRVAIISNVDENLIRNSLNFAQNHGLERRARISNAPDRVDENIVAHVLMLERDT